MLNSGLEVFLFLSPESMSGDVTAYFIKCTFDVVSYFTGKKVKVKQSRYRPGVAQRVPGS